MTLPPDAARQLVGPNADYYLSKWAQLPAKGPAVGFNVASFFLGPFWMLYRRMYRTVTIVIVASLAIGAAEVILPMLLGMEEFPKAVDSGINIAIAVTCGSFGTYWYHQELVRRYNRLARSGPPTPEGLAAAGGVSWLAVSVGVAVGVVLLYFMVASAGF